MVSFKSKDLGDRSIGQTLKATRESRGETLDDVERATTISKKYLTALENDQFKLLPEWVYAKNFVRTLAAHYRLDTEAIVSDLLQEMSAAEGRRGPMRHPVNFVSGRKLMVTPKIFNSAAASLAFLAVIGYFAFSINGILKPPAITIVSPKDNEVFSTRHVVLEGLTEPEVELTVNQEPVLLEADGSFKDTLNLPPGVAILRVAAKKKHSKESEVILKVIIEDTQPVAISSQ
jgi:transcriptional regulator with XRE-family HTH domain